MRHLWLLLVLVGCAKANTATGDDDDTPNDDGGSAPDAIPIDAGPLALTLAQNTDVGMVDNGVVCGQDHDSNAGTPLIAVENSYYRSFNLSQFTTDSFTATSVRFGVALVESAFGSTDVTLKLHHQMGALSTTNLTELHSQVVNLTNDLDYSIVEVPLSSPVFVAASTIFAVEIFVPDSSSAGNSRNDVIFIGGNGGGESAPSYWRAPATGCGGPGVGYPEPVTMATAGFPDMHILITVSGTSP